MKKFLIAVSGGPDSMFLLDHYCKKRPLVVHIIYEDNPTHQKAYEIVRQYCQDHNLELFTHRTHLALKGNAQAQARQERYQFYAKIYLEQNCDCILLAHHKDDFLETALMQVNSGRFPRFYGIRDTVHLYAMNIIRPFINKYWKAEILGKIVQAKIPFIDDISNLDRSFTRNNIRFEISKFSKAEKEDRYEWFRLANRILERKFKIVQLYFRQWKKTDFSLSYFRDLKRYQNEITFLYLHWRFSSIKLSRNKIEAVVAFLNGREGNKTFWVSEMQGIKKDHDKLV